jgi:hypothetical protein
MAARIGYNWLRQWVIIIIIIIIIIQLNPLTYPYGDTKL